MLHSAHRTGHNDLISKWRVIPTNCQRWSRNGYGAAEFISHESVTAEVATDILSLGAEKASCDPLLFL